MLPIRILILLLFLIELIRILILELARALLQKKIARAIMVRGWAAS
jgi:hypothetical protein